MTAQQVILIVDILIKLAYVALPLIAAWIGYYVKRFIASRATAQQQQVLASVALHIVQAAEQTLTGPDGAARKQWAMGMLRAQVAALHLPPLSDAQMSIVLESSVRALKAGVVAFAPNAAAILPATTSTTPQPALDMAGLKADVTALATTVAQGAVQSGLRDALASALGVQPLQPIQPAQAPVTINVAAPSAVPTPAAQD